MEQSQEFGFTRFVILKPVLISISLLLITCGKPLPDIQDVDLSKWKDDKKGCRHTRANSASPLIGQKDKLKGLSETDILNMLGRPDNHELYRRNQKFYYYNLDPDSSCATNSPLHRKLVIRFNAMSRAKEVVIEE